MPLRYGRPVAREDQRAGSGPGEETSGGIAERVTVIVDGANVMGSRADGWWRDRVGAMTRLHGELAGLAERGIPGEPPRGDAESGGEAGPAGGAGAGRWWPLIILVVEGRACAIVERVTAAPGVRVVAAARSGDDEIARVAASEPGTRIVVTADRELRRRCLAAGASVTGPRWLTRLLV
jgi:8-oxo-dGTP diphosphatase